MPRIAELRALTKPGTLEPLYAITDRWAEDHFERRYKEYKLETAP